jgi:hypothetical protein
MGSRYGLALKALVTDDEARWVAPADVPDMDSSELTPSYVRVRPSSAMKTVPMSECSFQPSTTPSTMSPACAPLVLWRRSGSIG